MLLVFDTSTSHLAIGVADDSGSLLQEFHADAGEAERGIHDARLAQETERLLKRDQIQLSALSRIGLIIGPGSFTGLRIGLSFAKGLAFATGAALVPLTQHEVIVAGVAEPAGAIIVIPAYRDNLLYIAEASAPRSVQLITSEALAALRGRPLILRGTVEPGLAEFVSSTSLSAPVSLSVMARLTSLELAPMDEFDDLEPLYLT